jgi:hypothetical protein
MGKISPEESIRRLLGYMEEAIEAADLPRLEKLWLKLKRFNPDQKFINDFGCEQICRAISNEKPPIEIETLEKELRAIGVNESAIDNGVEKGYSKNPIRYNMIKSHLFPDLVA